MCSRCNCSDTADLMPKPPNSSITGLLRQVLLEHKNLMTPAYYEDAYYRLLWVAYRMEIDNRLLADKLVALGESDLPEQIQTKRKFVPCCAD